MAVTQAGIVCSEATQHVSARASDTLLQTQITTMYTLHTYAARRAASACMTACLHAENLDPVPAARTAARTRGAAAPSAPPHPTAAHSCQCSPTRTCRLPAPPAPSLCPHGDGSSARATPGLQWCPWPGTRLRCACRRRRWLAAASQRPRRAGARIHSTPRPMQRTVRICETRTGRHECVV